MQQPGRPPVMVVASPKNMGLAILLTCLFGPLGMLYSTVVGALVMLVATVVVAVLTLGFGLIITWPVCVIWAALAAKDYNARLMAGVIPPSHIG